MPKAVFLFRNNSLWTHFYQIQPLYSAHRIQYTFCIDWLIIRVVGNVCSELFRGRTVFFLPLRPLSLRCRCGQLRSSSACCCCGTCCPVCALLVRSGVAVSARRVAQGRTTRPVRSTRATTRPAGWERSAHSTAGGAELHSLMRIRHKDQRPLRSRSQRYSTHPPLAALPCAS